jgi:hypothetical protein
MALSGARESAINMLISDMGHTSAGDTNTSLVESATTILTFAWWIMAGKCGFPRVR